MNATQSQTPTKIVVLAPWGSRLGGAERMLCDLLSGIDRDQFEVRVIFLEPGPMEREIAGFGVATAVVHSGRLRDLGRGSRAVAEFAREFRRERPDLILSWAAKPHLLAAPAAIATGHGDRLVWWQHAITRGRWMDRLATALPARAIGCSSAAAQESQRRLWPRRPTFVVHPGVRVGQSAPADPADLRTELRIPAERTVLGLVGRMQPGKGHLEFVRAVGELRRRGRDVHGLIVGGEAYRLSPGFAGTVADEVERLALNDAVTLTGHVDEVEPYFALADVILSLAANESFGIALLEAMLQERPVVAVDSGGPREIVRDQATGLLIGSDDPATVAAAIETLLENPAYRVQLGSSGRQRVLEQFTASHMVAGFQQALGGLARESAA